MLGQVAAIQQLLELGLPSDVQARLRRQVSNASHNIARLHLREKNLGEAWHWHLWTLRQAGGWRHIGFMRRLFAAALTS